MLDRLREHPIARRLRPIAVIGMGGFYIQTLTNCLLWTPEDTIDVFLDEWYDCSSESYGNLYGVTGQLGGTAVAVGLQGTVLQSEIQRSRRDMSQADACGDWSNIGPSTSATLRAAWQPEETSLWVAGGDGEMGAGEVYQYDGVDWTSWDDFRFISYNRIWGSSECNVYFLGGGISTDFPNGTHFDCSLMDTMTVDIGWSEITDISGTSPQDIWVVMNQTTHNLWHYDGTTWESRWEDWMDQPLFGVYALSEGDVVAVGANGAAYRFDGVEWVDRSIEGGGTDLHDVWGWRIESIDGLSVWIFAVGEDGAVYRVSSYTGPRSVVSTGASPLRAIWGEVGVTSAPSWRGEKRVNLNWNIYVVGDDGTIWVHRKLVEDYPSL